MLTITLPSDLEEVIIDQAQQRGTTPELLIQDDLRQRYLPSPPSVAAPEGQTMADFFAGYIGSINSSDVAPCGSDLSENTGRRFKELMLQKYREGKV